MTASLKPLCPTCLEITCDCTRSANFDFETMSDKDLKGAIRRLAIDRGRRATPMVGDEAYSAAWREARVRGITDVGV